MEFEYHIMAFTPVNCPNIMNATQNHVALQYLAPKIASFMETYIPPPLPVELVYFKYYSISE
jgi:hypothetical protein